MFCALPPCGSFVSVPEGSATTSYTAALGCQISFYRQNEYKTNVTSSKGHLSHPSETCLKKKKKVFRKCKKLRDSVEDKWEEMGSMSAAA